MSYISYIDDENTRRIDADNERARQERVALVEAMGNLMQTAEGRYVVRWILHTSGAFVAAYCSTLSMAQYREGRRSVGMEILKLCQESGTAEQLIQQHEDNNA